METLIRKVIKWNFHNEKLIMLIYYLMKIRWGNTLCGTSIGYVVVFDCVCFPSSSFFDIADFFNCWCFHLKVKMLIIFWKVRNMNTIISTSLDINNLKDWITQLFYMSCRICQQNQKIENCHFIFLDILRNCNLNYTKQVFLADFNLLADEINRQFHKNHFQMHALTLFCVIWRNSKYYFEISNHWNKIW